MLRRLSSRRSNSERHFTLTSVVNLNLTKFHFGPITSSLRSLMVRSPSFGGLTYQNVHRRTFRNNVKSLPFSIVHYCAVHSRRSIIVPSITSQIPHNFSLNHLTFASSAAGSSNGRHLMRECCALPSQRVKVTRLST